MVSPSPSAHLHARAPVVVLCQAAMWRGGGFLIQKLPKLGQEHSQDEDLSKLRFLQDEAPKHHTHKLQKQSSIMRGNYMPTLSTFMKAPRQAGEPSSSVTSTIALSFDEIVLRQKGFAILQKPNAATTGMCWSTKTAILHGRQGLENVGLWWQHHLSHKTHSSKAGLHLLCFVLARA